MQCFIIFLTLDFVLNLFLRCCFSDFVILVHFFAGVDLVYNRCNKIYKFFTIRRAWWSHIFDHISIYRLRFGSVRGTRCWSIHLRSYHYGQEEGQDVLLT